MTKTEITTIKQQITEAKQDIALYQKHIGPMVVFDPSSEAYKLSKVIISLEGKIRTFALMMG